MNALVYLYVQKLKSQLRHIFSKPGSAIFTVLLVLLYGGGFIGILMNPDFAMSVAKIEDVSQAIMVAIGFTALMIGSVLMQKRAALFYEGDAHYLFSGPFRRKQIMHFLMSNNILSSMMFACIGLFMLVFFGGGIGFSGGFLVLTFVLLTFVSFFFIEVRDYLYVLAIENEKLKVVSRLIVFGLLLVVVALFGIALVQYDFQMKEAIQGFISGDLFYVVPLFGWVKLALVAYIEMKYVQVALASGLILLVVCVIFMLMGRYHGDFVEQAMQDAQEFTAVYKDMKAGKRNSLSDKKVKEVNGKFKEGAAAIFSKNMLLMKKTNDFIAVQDMIVLGVYLLLTKILDMGFFFFCYMLLFWLMATLQRSDLMRDMNNYQIYLIPDAPFKKLWNTVKATLFKLWLIIGVSILIAAIVFAMDVYSVLQYFFMIEGYALLFVASSVLCIRIMKSRNNMLVENLLRLLILVIVSIPSVVVLLPLLFMNQSNPQLLSNIITIANLVMNFIVSFAILYCCRSMMNGRELKSE